MIWPRRRRRVVNRAINARASNRFDSSCVGRRFAACAYGDFDQRRQRVRAGVNVRFEDGRSFRRHVDMKRYGINPALAIVAARPPNRPC